MNAFGIPEGTVTPLDEDVRVGKTRPMQGIRLMQTTEEDKAVARKMNDEVVMEEDTERLRRGMRRWRQRMRMIRRLRERIRWRQGKGIIQQPWRRIRQQRGRGMRRHQSWRRIRWW